MNLLETMDKNDIREFFSKNGFCQVDFHFTLD